MTADERKTSKIQVLCKHCGSTNISRDAWSNWNVDGQQWELRTVFDHAHCHECDGETTLVECELAD